MSNVDTFVKEITNLLSSGEESKAMAVWDQIACEEDVPTVVEVHRKLADVGVIQRLILIIEYLNIHLVLEQ